MYENTGASAAPGPRREADEARLAAVADEWAAAIVSNDTARIGAFMAGDWVIVSESGLTTRERFLALVESGELTHSAMQSVSRPRVRVHGDWGTVTARVTNTAHHMGRRFDADEWTTDVFVRAGGGRWLCVLSHITAAAPE